MIDSTDLVAIPAGDEPDDKVIPTEDCSAPSKWNDCLINNMIQKCSDSNKKEHLLRYHYGQQILHSVTSTAKRVSLVEGEVGLSLEPQ